jgi:hypothetical protein
MGISPELFGPSFWGALHYACLVPENPDKVKEFIALYPYVLPCIGCREHFNQVLQEFPIPAEDDSKTLFEWSVMVHNLVNVRLGKPEFTAEEAIKHWGRLPEPPEPRPEVVVVPPFPWYLVAIIVILILIIIFMKFKK